MQINSEIQKNGNLEPTQQPLAGDSSIASVDKERIISTWYLYTDDSYYKHIVDRKEFYTKLCDILLTRFVQETGKSEAEVASDLTFDEYKWYDLSLLYDSPIPTFAEWSESIQQKERKQRQRQLNIPAYVEKLKSMGVDLEVAQRAVESYAAYNNDPDPDMATMQKCVNKELDAIEEKQRMLERQYQVLNQQKKTEANKDYTMDITDYLVSRNLARLNIRELCDEFYSQLSETEKESYFNKPMFAFYKCMNVDDPRIEQSISKCVEKLSRSKIIYEKVTDYIHKNMPDRVSDEWAVEQLAERAADVVKVKYDNDPLLCAYDVILTEKEKDVRKINSSDIKDNDELMQEALLNFTARVKAGEPYDVAAQCAFSDDFLKKLAEDMNEDAVCVDKEKSTETILKGLGCDEKGTVLENNEKEIKKEKTLADEYKSICETLTKELNAVKEEIKETKEAKEQKEPRREYTRRDSDYTYDRDRDMDRRYPDNKQGLEYRHIGTIFMAALGILFFLMGKLGGVPTTLCWICSFISAVGFALKPGTKDKQRVMFVPMIGIAVGVFWLLL